MKNSKTQKVQTKAKNNRFLTTFVCVFLSLILILGATLGIVSGVKVSRSAARYKGQTMDVETASFFASYYKYIYMSTLSRNGVVGVENTPDFWNKDAAEGASYAKLLTDGTKNYIKQILVGNYLYDKYTRLSSSDKERISSAVNELIEYKANGDKKTFNELVSEYGFSYSSFRNAVTMIYKASTVQDVIYGTDGSNIANFHELAEEYLLEYSHVKLLFIRTQDKFVYQNGERVIGEDGNYLLEALTPDEIRDREKVISEMRSGIAAIDSGVGVEMSEEMFNSYLNRYDEGDEDMRADGYYFSKHSSFTAEFSTVFQNIVDKSYEMPINSFAEISVDFGVCFIYKTEPTEGAYAFGASEACFTDFYSDASNFLFEKSISELSEEVMLRERLSEIDFISIPYNYAYLPNF